MIPQELKYTESHEWIRVEGNQGTVGITHYAQEQLGDIVFVELPEVGSSFGKGEVFGSIESVKSVGDIYLPVSGTVTEINEKLLDQPELINKDPYGEGWIVKIEIENSDELDTLLSADEYQAKIG